MYTSTQSHHPPPSRLSHTLHTVTPPTSLTAVTHTTHSHTTHLPHSSHTLHTVTPPTSLMAVTHSHTTHLPHSSHTLHTVTPPTSLTAVAALVSLVYVIKADLREVWHVRGHGTRWCSYFADDLSSVVSTTPNREKAFTNISSVTNEWLGQSTYTVRA